VLESRPNFSQIVHQSTTKKDLKMLVAPRVRMLGQTGCFDAPEMFAIPRAVATKNNHGAAIVIARAPEPVTLMIANGLGQTETRSEEIDRPGLTITVGKDGRAGALVRGKFVVNSSGFA